MRGYRGASGHPNACCCDSSKCEEIGYSHEGVMRVPQDASTSTAVVATGTAGGAMAMRSGVGGGK